MNVIGIVNANSQCTAPNPPSLSSLVFNTTDTQLSVYFSTSANSPSTNINYLGIISTNSTLGANPVNGTVYNIGDNIGNGTVFFYDQNFLYKKTGLIANTTYYIYIFSARTACTGQPFYSNTSLISSATTFNGGPGIPGNYYDAANGLYCSNLKTALYNIIKPTVSDPNPTYTGLWSAYSITDDRLNDGNNQTIVWDVYTDNPSGGECEFTFGLPYQDQGSSGTIECQRYNREHSFPRAWFGGNVNPMYSDMAIVYPTDKKVNSYRGNFPYGEVNNPTYTSNNGTKLGPNTFSSEYTGTSFEPIDEYKGDLARSTFYVATAYENLISGWQGNSNANDVLNGTSYKCFDNWYLQLLYQWHQQDPVSSKEIDRNNDIYMIQGNRNPYIDHPEYVALVWQCSGVLPVTIIDFTAKKYNQSILLNWYATYETNFKKYEIERSTDGANFYKIGEVEGKNFANYSYTDNNLPNANNVYYRLRMINWDGSANQSKTVQLRVAENFYNAIIFPNPVKEKLTIKLPKTLTVPGWLMITDISGRIVLQQKISAGERNIILNIGHFPAGRYFININTGLQVIHQSVVIVK